MKVGYRLRTGGISVVHLSDPDNDDSDEFPGVDKYTGKPVTVRWSSETLQWIEVPS